MKAKNFWIIEDSDEDFEIMKVIFEDIGVSTPFERFDDGSRAIEKLQKMAPKLPSLILLDLNLPELDGKEFLSIMKEDPRLRRVPIIVLTTSQNPKDIDSCFELGVNAYLSKPVDLGELKHLLRNFNQFWLEDNIYPECL